MRKGLEGDMAKKPRPKVLQGGSSFKLKTGCGNLYVVINQEHGDPFEVFAFLGKAGSCVIAQTEALTRSISLGLRYGVPVEDYIDQLQNIRCPEPYMWPEEERVLSCADGIAKAL